MNTLTQWQDEYLRRYDVAYKELKATVEAGKTARPSADQNVLRTIIEDVREEALTHAAELCGRAERYFREKLTLDEAEAYDLSSRAAAYGLLASLLRDVAGGKPLPEWMREP